MALFHGPACIVDDLAQNNNKDWFEANRKRYGRDVKEPAVALVTALAPRLATLSLHLRKVAKGNGSSVSRIHPGLCRTTFGAGRTVDVTLPQDQLVDAVSAAWRDAWPLMRLTCAALGLAL